MNRIVAFGILSALPVIFCAAVEAPSPPVAQRIITETRHILSDAKESHYQHSTHVDEAEGVYDLDCSGLLCVVLKKVSPEHLKGVPHAAHRSRPLALQFYEFFTAAGVKGEKGDQGWRGIKRMRDARPGDAIAWRNAVQVPGKSTGHVMIIDETPVEDGPGLYRVVVIDSTGTPHGNDTRKDGATGIGRGTMWFAVDSEGRPTAYHWKSRTAKAHEIQIAIGRAVDN